MVVYLVATHEQYEGDYVSDADEDHCRVFVNKADAEAFASVLRNSPIGWDAFVKEMVLW